MKLDKINIELDYNSKVAKVKTIYENRIKSEKNISIGDLIENIMNSIDEVQYASILSPLHEERKGVKLIQVKHIGRTGAIYIMQRKKEYAPMPIHTRMYGNVGIPSLLFAIKVINNKVDTMYAVCVKDEVITYDTDIFYYPYSNVSSFSAKVCLGSNRFTPGVEDDNLRQLYEVPNMFLSMPNNGYDFSSSCNAKCYSVEEMIRLYENIEFDDEILVPHKVFNKYKNFVETVGGI